MGKYPDGLYIKDDKVTNVMAHPIVNASGTLLGINNALVIIFSF